MKEDVKDLWVKALRSGDYKQGRKTLCRGGWHCCLGVLCEVLGVAKRPAAYDGHPFTFGESRNTATLPDEAMELSGMKTESGDYDERSLTIDNDHGYSFAEIADIIEAHWEQL